MRSLIEGLSPFFEIFTLFREKDSVYLLDSSGEVKQWKGEPPVWPATPYSQPLVETALRAALDIARPDVIHIHHLHNWPLAALDILTDFGRPTVLTLHDYYFVTPYFTMQGVKGAEECFSSDYSKRVFGVDISSYLLKRKAVVQKGLSKVTKVLAPSKFAIDELSKVFSFEGTVVEHGIKYFEAVPRQHPFLFNRKSIRFGYIGSLLPQKGWDILAQAFIRLRKHEPEVSLHFFGGVADVPDSEKLGITFYGVYEQEDLPTVASQMDVAIIPSIFPETFCLTLSELWHARVPVAASKIGALSHRIIDGMNGKLFEPGNVESLYRTLVGFVQDNSWQEWTLPMPRLLGDMVTEYANMYTEL